MNTKTKNQQRKCLKCGEPEMVGAEGGGEFGWFTTEEGGRFVTYCNRCGLNPLTGPSKRKVR